jgi:hydroxymethylpyrimidine pyrophosphatase-like HAD family hydrolase
MALRCVYADLDGTMLGKGGSLFRDSEGEFTMLPARAIEACNRAGVELFLMSGRRRAQVAEPARLFGAGGYCFEIGGGLVIDGEEQWLCGEFDPREDSTPWELIAASGAPALLEERFDELRPFTPWNAGREVSHLYRGEADVRVANELLDAEGHGGLKLIDNGFAEEGGTTFHLVPATASKAAAVALHMRARAYAREECLAVGDSAEDAEVGGVVGRYAEVTEPGTGFYEAVIQALVSE